MLMIDNCILINLRESISHALNFTHKSTQKLSTNGHSNLHVIGSPLMHWTSFHTIYPPTKFLGRPALFHWSQMVDCRENANPKCRPASCLHLLSASDTSHFSSYNSLRKNVEVLTANDMYCDVIT